METAALKSFSTWARKALIREITARITAVLAPGSPERIELPRSVAALEAAIKEAGGTEAGRAAVADRVAYTWFNRIIALRFMDANGYNRVGVVSPPSGAEFGQPEILAEAKRGVFEDAVNVGVSDAVTALLDGTRPSVDPPGEAYALLLTEYCRHWHRAMPFMFERAGDFTELLMPPNLLADDSVLNRAVTVMTTDACKDVEVIGWLYQFYISERKDEVFAGFKKGKKAGAAEIPAATQLFTPHWIVRYLVENSVGRLWMLNRPGSRLVEQMDYYIAPVDEETDFLKIGRPEELTVMDPACGSGHMLTYAFDLLYAIYEEEGYSPSDIPGLILKHNLFGIEIDPRAGALAAFALTMKARGKQRTFFSRRVKPNICVLESIRFTPEELDVLLTPDGDRDAEVAFWNQFEHADLFGSLILPEPSSGTDLALLPGNLDAADDMYAADLNQRAQGALEHSEYLTQRYSVIVANPPYMDARNMSTLLDDYLDSNYPTSSTGLDIAFISRANAFLAHRGIIGFLTLDSWISSFETRTFRKGLLDDQAIRLCLHLGPGAFDQIGGEVVRVVATIFGCGADSQSPIVFLAAADLPRGKKEKVFGDRNRMFLRTPDWFGPFPLQSLAPYSAPDEVHELYAKGTALASYAEARTGLQTGNNDRFIRYWHEVDRSKIRSDGSEAAPWVWFVKSPDASRWFAREDKVLFWESDGEEVRNHPSSVVRNSAFYFRDGISFAGRGKDLRARYVQPGAVYDQQNSMVFVDGMSIAFALGLLNSRAAEVLVRASSPAKFNIGAMKQIPIRPDTISDTAIEEIVTQAIDLTKRAWDADETSSGFGRSTLLTELSPSLSDCFARVSNAASETASKIREIEQKVDCYFNKYFGISTSREISTPLEGTSNSLLSNHFASYAVGCMFGRYSLDEPGLILADQGATLQDYLAKVPNPTFTPDADNVIPIVDGDWFEDDIVARFRTFLRVAFGEEHFEENLRFVTESLGVRDIRDYFVKSFYKDHVQRYKKRPIYWLFSSPKGSFNALIYMHRYTPSTVSTVLNEYLREYKAKLKANQEHQERPAASGGTPRQQAAAQKEVDRLRKVLLELDEYEHNVLYPLATQQIVIDLDDGVKANYPKFGAALKKIPGLDAAE